MRYGVLVLGALWACEPDSREAVQQLYFLNSPFVRRAALPGSAVGDSSGPSKGRIVRMDQASKPAPHLPKPAWLPDTKHAP